MKFEQGNKFGNRFSSTNQPLRAGRKVSTFNTLRKAGLSAEDCKILIQYLLTLSREEITEIAKDKETPIFQGVIAKSLADGNFKALMELLRFTYGSKIEIEDVTQKSSGYTHAQVKELFQEMKKAT